MSGSTKKALVAASQRSVTDLLSHTSEYLDSDVCEGDSSIWNLINGCILQQASDESLTASFGGQQYTIPIEIGSILNKMDLFNGIALAAAQSDGLDAFLYATDGRELVFVFPAQHTAGRECQRLRIQRYGTRVDDQEGKTHE